MSPVSIYAVRGGCPSGGDPLGAGKRSWRDPDPRKGGFTLVEVMFASSILLLLFLTLLETLSVCLRMAANVKWRLAADALAYDTAWEVFNSQTAWFDAQCNQTQAQWARVPAERTSVWYGGGGASVYSSITPVGLPATKWVIRTNVQWPLPDSKFAKLPSDYVVERWRADRNLFRAAN